jgi:ABC-2 type transport system ATP-binding protein
VWEALDLFSSLVPSGQPWEIVLDQWGLSPKRDAKFGNLSGGQQQRLFVALAVVNAPRLVFFDEMTTGLDPMSRRVTWDLVRQVRDQGTTVVLVTHFMDEAEELCDRIAVINEKRVVAIDTPDGLVEQFGGGATVTFSTDAADLAFLDRIEEVDGVSQQGRRITVTGHGALLASVAAELVKHGLKPIDLASHKASLEDVFLTITGEVH